MKKTVILCLTSFFLIQLYVFADTEPFNWGFDILSKKAFNMETSVVAKTTISGYTNTVTFPLAADEGLIPKYEGDKVVKAPRSPDGWTLSRVTAQLTESYRTGNIGIEFSFYASNSDNAEIAGIYGTDINDARYAVELKNGYVQIGNQNVIPYTPGKWYDVKIIVDTDKKQYRGFVGEKGGSFTASGVFSKPHLTSVTIFWLLNDGSNSNSELIMYYDDVILYKYKGPVVTVSDKPIMAAKQIPLTFDIDVPDFTVDDVQVNGGETSALSLVKTDCRHYTIFLAEKMLYDAEYEINISNLTDALGTTFNTSCSFTTVGMPLFAIYSDGFYDGNNPVFSMTATSIVCRMILENNTQLPVKTAAVAALYKKYDGICIMEDIVTQTIEDFTGEKNISLTLNNIPADNNYFINMYAVSSLKEIMPYSQGCYFGSFTLGNGYINNTALSVVAPESKAAVVDDEGIVTIYGSIGSAEQKNLVVALLPPDIGLDDLESNIKEKAVMLYELQSNAYGNYQMKTKLGSGDVSGDYQVTIAIEGKTQTESEKSILFYYASDTERNYAISDVNSASQNNIKSIFTIYQKTLNLKLDDEYERLEDYINRSFLAIRQQAGGFNKIIDIRNAFLTAKVIAKIKNATSEQINILLTENIDLLEITANDDFEKYKSAVCAAFAVLKKEKALLVPSDVNDIFAEALVIGTVNESNREELTSVLKRYNGILKLNIDGDYIRHIIDVNKALIGKSFASVKAIRDAFNKMLDYLIRPIISEGRGSAKVQNISIATPDIGINKSEDVNIKIKFNDLDNVKWAAEGIERIAEKGIVAGYEDGSFKPDDNVTREQFLKMIIILFELGDETAQCEYSDTVPADWHYPYIASAAKCGITKGLGDGKFGVGRSITREEMAVLAYRAATVTGLRFDKTKAFAFADEAQISIYALEAVFAMQQSGIINGMEGKFFPKEYATRAEAAKIIYELLKLGEANT